MIGGGRILLGTVTSRIAALPCRNWEDLAAEAAEILTPLLRTPYGTQTLREEQAIALLELSELGGLAAAMAVGQGKTLVAGLAPTVTDHDSALLITGGGLVESTRDHLIKLSHHWQIPVDRIVIKSYEWLSLGAQRDFLDRSTLPRLWIFDEGHRLKALLPDGRRPSAVPVRIERRLAADPNVQCIYLSGTFTEDGLLDYGHCFNWALKENSPVPRTAAAQRVWHAGLTSDRPERYRTPLSHFEADLGPLRSYSALRQRFCERLHASPGVIISTKAYAGSRLTLEPVTFPLGEQLDGHFQALRQTQIAPDNWDLANAGMGGESYDCARKLALGYYPKHDPWPPDEWYNRRRNYGKWLRRFLEGAEEYETEGQVEAELRRGKIQSQAWDEWIEVAHTFHVHRVAQWESVEVIERLAAWIQEQDLPQLCIWSAHRAFAARFAEYLDCPWFSNHGKSASGEHIEKYRGRYAVSSIGANATGLNLQYHFSNALVVGAPSTNFLWEQMIGRHYRSGQQADTVRFFYLATCAEHLAALRKAQRKAQEREAQEKMPCALNRAEITWASPGEGWAWAGNETES